MLKNTTKHLPVFKGLIMDTDTSNNMKTNKINLFTFQKDDLSSRSLQERLRSLFHISSKTVKSKFSKNRQIINMFAALVDITQLCSRASSITFFKMLANARKRKKVDKGSKTKIKFTGTNK